MPRDSYTKSDFAHFYPHQTRWHDNDLYGHINNVIYYSYMDSAVNRYLIEYGGLDIHHAPIVAYVVHSSCDYFSPLAYPDALELAIAVKKLGNRSVSYCVGIFKQGKVSPSAVGEFVHVFVDRASDRSVAIPCEIRKALQKLEMNHDA